MLGAKRVHLLHDLMPNITRIALLMHADALFGVPDIIATVAGDDIRLLNEVMDQIDALDDVNAPTVGFIP